MSEKKENLVKLVKQALKKVYDEQKYLIDNKVHERSIVFWFGIYLYELVKDTKFSEYNLDFEYNRNYKQPKSTKNFRAGTYPDIILHKRGSNEDNLLIIEFKPYWENDINIDLRKLKDFTDNKGKYKYLMGFLIVIEKDQPIIKSVINGEVIDYE
ncbi:hypothetical protein [uncultured Candidatus Kuenenia sp.]|uniref:hypothetical protein n=1 Tax=uncultured Candidatus Kuenenia sp. TaxID=1048336 RepID=UPI0002EA29C9|nr:hypothetical protein [uncultured Candidatus Kuenenia sp.]